jgi:hypothetical protein
MKISKEDFLSYVEGWLFVNSADPNFSHLDINNMRAALLNAENCLNCPSDGIKAYIERRKHYKNLDAEA